MASTIVLITGANRGLGFGLAAKFLAQDETTVIAAVRTPTSADFSNLKRGRGSEIFAIRYDAAAQHDAAELVAEIQKRGINHLDLVVANAAIANAYPTVKVAQRKEMLDHYDINVFGVIWLYQATWDLLKNSTKEPMFVPIGSAAGSLGAQPNVANAAYGPTKAAIHWYAVRIDAEEDWLTSFALNPGWVQTDMGNFGAKTFGLESAPLGIDESVSGMYKVLTTATKEKFGGRLVSYEGKIEPW